MARPTDEEIIAENKERRRRVYNIDNPYGYVFNINNDVLNAWFKRYVSKLDGKDGTEPQVRLEWERRVKALIARKYEDFYHTKLCEPIIGFTKQRVEELVIALGANYED